MKIRPDARIGDAHILAGLLDLVNAGLVDERRGKFLLACEHAAILCPDAEARLSIVDGGHSVADLSELTALSESRE